MAMRYLLVIGLIGYAVISIGQITADWATSHKISLSNYGKTVKASPDGAIYVSGKFTGSYRNPGPTEMGGALFRYDSKGILEWEKVFYSQTSAIEMFHAVATDGSVYLVTSYGCPSYLYKYKPDGSEIFKRPIGPKGVITGLLLDEEHNFLHMTGYINTDVYSDFEGVPIYKSDFLASYKTDGSFNWITELNNSLTRNFDISNDQKGNVYVTSEFYYTVEVIDGFYANAGANNDGYVAKISSDGQLVWFTQLGGLQGSEMPKSVVVNKNGEVFVGGVFDRASDFGCSIVESRNRGGDIFVAKYSAEGTCEWVRTAGSPQEDRLFDLYTDTSGNVFAIGNFGSPDMTVGGNILDGDSAAANVFLLHYNSSGTLVQSMCNTSGSANGFGVTGDGKGALYITGNCGGKFAFGGLSINGDSEMYLIKLNYHLDNRTVNLYENKAATIRCYPNPATERFSLLLPENETISTISVLNTLGEKTSIPVSLEANRLEGNVERLPKGIYLVTVRNSKGALYTCRLIKD